MRAHWLALVVVCGCGSVPAAPDANAELCFDGMDNDGDGAADCADPGCDVAARCVPDSADQPAGVIVDATAACPEGFTGGETIIHRGLQAGACNGCGCTVGPTTCTASVWVYDQDLNECNGDVALTGGDLVGFQITDTCSAANLANLMLYGVRVDMHATGTCTPSGTGTPGTSSWSESVKFCKSSHVAGGCAAGSTCVARAADPQDQCALADTTGTCAAGYTATQSDWYTDYDDQRSCGACFCEAVGGDCTNVLVQVGSDYSCINAWQVADDTKQCFPPNGDYSPPALLVGTPTPATGCTADAPTSGEITPTGQTTLCCAPS